MKRIVILGAGFGGISVVRRISKQLQFSEVEYKMTVIDRSHFHVFTPLLYEVATGIIEHENIGTAKFLQGGVTINNADLFSRFGADFIEDEIMGIDWQARHVLVKKGEPIAFDFLVIALGAETNFFDIEGMRDIAFTLKSLKDADRLRQRVQDFLYKKKRGDQEKISIVIGGAGATGVELAGELTFFLRQHMMHNNLAPEDFDIALVEAQPRILGALSKKISDFTIERLKNLGVRLYLDSAVKEVTLNEVTLVPRACKPGETIDQLVCDFKKEGSKTIPADITIWTGGIRGCSVLEKFGIPLRGNGKRIEVDATLAVPDHENVFALGDAALLMNPQTKQPVPWLAQAAIEHGVIVGKTIANRLCSTGSDAQYTFHEYPVVVPLGGKFAVAKIGPVILKGFSGWILKELVELRYFLKILPFFKAISFWWHGARIYGKND